MKITAICSTTLAVLVSFAVHGLAQAPVPPPEPVVPLRSAAELDQMLAPIALYPDPLIAEILPAATQPAEIVLADRFVQSGQDVNLIDQQPWSSAVKALARYPDLLKWMDDNLAWTTDLGQTFINQSADVMNSIQRLRAQAQALGNLPTTQQQRVIYQDGIIEVLPANPQVIYVPVYEPEFVYFRRPFGSPFISFGFGFAIGGWLNHDCDWHDRGIIVWRRDHPRPSDWWYRPAGQRLRPAISHRNIAVVDSRTRVDVGPTVWRPRSRPPISTSDRGDRGWGNRESSPAPVRATQPAPTRSAEPRRPGSPAVRPAAPPTVQRPAPSAVRSAVPPTVQRPAPPVVRPALSPTPPRPAPVSARPTGGALIGVRSVQETRQFSNRGQQSRQAITRPIPTAPPAASARPAPGRSAPTRRTP
ncbi:MAG: DUF3300 domain-containing protein [Limisphaerales bacterium]